MCYRQVANIVMDYAFANTCLELTNTGRSSVRLAIISPERAYCNQAFQRVSPNEEEAVLGAIILGRRVIAWIRLVLTAR